MAAAIRTVELVLRGDEPHALPAASGSRLEQHREADLDAPSTQLGKARRAFRSGHERDTGGAQLLLRADLVPHPLHDVCPRPDEDEIRVLARSHEGRVLGEEAVPGMNRATAGRLGRGNDVRDAEVALGRGRWPDAHRPVRERDVHRIRVGCRVHGDRLDVELVECANDANRDLATVRDEDAGERRH